MYLPALPTMTGDLHTTATLTAYDYSNFVRDCWGEVFVGPLSDRYGRRMPLIISMAFYVRFLDLLHVCWSIELLVALRLVQGFAGAAGIVLSRAVVRDLYSGTELTKFFALLMLVNGAAPICSTRHWGRAASVYFLAWGFLYTISN